MGKVVKKKYVKMIVRRYKVSLVVMLETRFKAKKFTKICDDTFPGWKAMNNYYFAINGTIWINWDPSVLELDYLSGGDQYLHVKVHHILEGCTTLLSVVYASNSEIQRTTLWNQLRNLQADVTEPWVCLADFNEAIYTDEKKASGVINLHATGLKEFCLDMDLLDVTSVGSFYTSTNNQQGNDRVLCKLDRVMANKPWLATFESTFVDYMELHASDHVVALLQVRRSPTSAKPTFKYLAMWQAHENYDRIVNEASQGVNDASLDIAFGLKFGATKAVLKQLNTDYFKDI